MKLSISPSSWSFVASWRHITTEWLLIFCALTRRCDRASTIRSVIGASRIQISNGGGIDLPTSIRSQFFSCPDFQIMALHDYDLDPSYVASNIDPAKTSAITSGQRLLYEEFGALG